MPHFLITFLFLTAFAHGQKSEIFSPNVVIFLVDDLGWKDLSYAGSKFHETPAIDQLARDGVTFTNAYASSSICSPTRAALMSGKHPARVGITDWIPGFVKKDSILETPQDLHQLPLEELTIGEAFQENGYITFYGGKWHLGGTGYGPEQQGFSIYTDPHNDSSKGSPGKQKLKGRRHGTEELTQAAINFLKTDHQKPHFLILSYFDVHTPVIAEKSFLGKYEQKAKALGPSPSALPEGKAKTRARQDNPAYASMVQTIDHSVERILSTIKTHGQEEKTIVVFTSDNGGLSTTHWTAPTCNLPLRAGKGFLYEGGIRIPLIIKSSKLKPTRKKNLALSTDLYPTLLSLAGLKLRPAQHLDGHDLFSPQAEKTRPTLWHFPHYHSSTWTPGSALRWGPWKLIHFYETQKNELYHLETDPGETKNLNQSNPADLTRMRKKMEELIKEVSAKKPTLRNR